MRTKNVTYFLSFFVVLLNVPFTALYLYYHSLNESLWFYYVLPRELYLVAASELYSLGQFFNVVLVGYILIILAFISLILLIQIFWTLSKNFEFFDDAWRALKAFTLECFKKKKLMLFAPLSYAWFGFVLGLFYAWINLPKGPFLMFSSFYFTIGFFYSSPLLIPLNIHFLMILWWYAQTGLMYSIIIVIFIALIPVFAIGLLYYSAFWKKVESLSPNGSISPNQDLDPRN